jgi:hypothetical protein
MRRDRRKVHAMNMVMEVLCGRRAKRTSIVKSRYDRLAKLVTCKTCLRILHSPTPVEQK